MRFNRHKFNAIRTERDGIKFGSKKEAKYYSDLKLRKSSGEVIFFLRQVPIDLPGNVKYRVDFVEFHADGTVHFIEVKGLDVPMGKLKRKQTEALYPITIEVV
ncbi:DUF1064 domain-containing protein [bacterium]|nr:DUF1064 domain-containing protein [Candidatus Omnitrophota bacterium]MBA3065546.1 DUF1064 domain-containing protein [bacterium]